MEEGVSIKYVVEFQIYHFNMGAGDNGSYVYRENFDTLQQAKDFYNKVELFLWKLKKKDMDTKNFVKIIPMVVV